MTLGEIERVSHPVRPPSPSQRVVVVSEDPGFWVGLRRELTDLTPTWVLARTARESLVAIEDPRVKVVVLDGAMAENSAQHILRLLKQIRPEIAIVFAFQCPGEEWERGVREAGVLYYGDRNVPVAMVDVIRKTLRRSQRPPPGRMPVAPDGD
jgi:DNA-binding NarL/FixJ family response regulator